jgi:hypothetical protein
MVNGEIHRVGIASEEVKILLVDRVFLQMCIEKTLNFHFILDLAAYSNENTILRDVKMDARFRRSSPRRNQAINGSV